MSRAELETLAERCEAANGPDRRLDTLVEIAVHPDKPWIIDHEPGRFPRKPIYGTFSDLREWAEDETLEPPEISAPRYTASVDSAMLLVPEGCHWSVGFGAVPGSDKPLAFAGVSGSGGGGVLNMAVAPQGLIALALTAACLRALAARENDDG